MESNAGQGARRSPRSSSVGLSSIGDLAELADLYENAPCGYHTLDRAGRFQRINRTALSWLGCERAEVVGRLSPTDFLTPAGRDSFRIHFPRIVAGEELRGIELDLVSRAGEVRRVRLDATPVLDEAGAFLGTRSVLHDIRAEEDAEAQRARAAELRAQVALLHELGAMKSAFLANVSHALRTPLNGVLGFTELLQDGSVPPGSAEHASFLAHIWQSGRQLLQLVEAMLVSAEAERGKLAFHPECVDVRSVLDEVVAALAPQIQAKGARVRIDAARPLGTVRTDRGRLAQLFFIFVDNAVKFSQSGGEVEVRLRVSAGRLEVQVEDAGVGIAPADIPRLFRPFEPLGAPGSVPGTGLGLSVARLLVEGQGGSLGAHSELGRGSTFHFALPTTA